MATERSEMNVGEEKLTNILIVDDLPENLLAMESVIEAPDLNIIKADSGSRALELVLENDFALILLDVQMPEMDGFEVAQLIRRTKKTDHIPIIFVTAISKENKFVFRGYEKGAVDYLAKPIDPLILRSKVKVFAELHRQRRVLQETSSALETTVRDLQHSEKTRREREQGLLQKQQMETIGRLAGGIAQEINNPLSLEITYLKKIKKSLSEFAQNREQCQTGIRAHTRDSSGEGDLSFACDKMDFDDLQKNVQMAMNGSYRIRDIVKDLMLCASRDNEKRVPLRINGVVDKAIKLTMYEIKYRARINHRHENVPLIYADESHLMQVFLHLLVNAANAMEGTDVEKNEISVRTWVDGEDILTEISDTGRGIPEEHLPKIFEPFFSTGKKSEGFGLGLFVSNEIISSLGGRIDVTSELGKGSKFVVRLPLKGNTASSPPLRK